MNNLEIAKLFYEKMWSEADFEVAEKIIHEDYHPKDVMMPEKGPALLKKEISYFRSIFPDLQYKIVDYNEEKEKIWIRYKGIGTQEGDGWGFPANGKSVEFEGCAILTIRDGKVVDAWRNYSLFDIFVQLGHIPPLWELAEKL